MNIIDLYAGCGGWSEGIKSLGLRDVGYEYMLDACKTRIAAGHETVHADLSDISPVSVDVLIASPPCQTFSMAGNGSGRSKLGKLIDKIDVGDWSMDEFDDRTNHVLVPGNWIDKSGCTTVIMEQVPPALPLWNAYMRLLQRRGWSAWSGILCAADFGVPQTRRRAFLVASMDRIIKPPNPTHCKAGDPSLFDQLIPWVSMSQALGWEDNDLMLQPGGQAHSSIRRIDRPAPTIAFGKDQYRWSWIKENKQPVRFAIQEALTLQSFSSDYPLVGSMTSQFLQVGNAVPPLMAKHIVAAALGIDLTNKIDL